MRITMEHPLAKDPAFHLYLDGVLQLRATEADDEAGYLIRWQQDEEGKLLTSYFGPLQEVLHGRVEFFMGKFPVVGWKKDGTPVLRYL